MANWLQAMRAVEGVESVSDEREYYQGKRCGGVVFVNLKPGYSFAFEASAGGFDTVPEAQAAVRGIIMKDILR